jgi:citrate/tricarballylate utilization protein
MATPEHLREAERLMTICNACRYCEGLCAVFPAMEMRRVFSATDLVYLANLCHQCGACYSDCQYSPPHEFAVNVPSALAKLRHDSYRDYAWPRMFGGLFARNGLAVTIIAALSVAGFIVGFVVWRAPAVLFVAQGADFYKVMPHGAMAGLFSAVTLYVIASFGFSLRAFWRDISREPPDGLSLAKAGRDSATLHYLGGGGAGCTSEDERPSQLRRVYHYALGWQAPYGWTSAPVILGTLGGIGLLIGPAGLYALSCRRDPVLTDPSRRGMDVAFLAMLFLTSLTGLLLLVVRDTPVMGMTLALHLGFVLGLFLSMPYGKFVHGLYRFLALAKYARERRSAIFID